MGEHSLPADLIKRCFRVPFPPLKDPFSLTQADLSADKRPRKCSFCSLRGGCPRNGVFMGECVLSIIFSQTILKAISYSPDVPKS